MPRPFTLICPKCDSPKVWKKTRLRCRVCATANMRELRATKPEYASKKYPRKPGHSTAWYRANLEAGRAYVARYTLRRRTAGMHTDQEWQTVKEHQGFRCFDCASSAKLSRGHLIPVVRGGTNHISNIVAQCKSCNSSQYTRVHAFALYPRAVMHEEIKPWHR